MSHPVGSAGLWQGISVLGSQVGATGMAGQGGACGAARAVTARESTAANMVWTVDCRVRLSSISPLALLKHTSVLYSASLYWDNGSGGQMFIKDKRFLGCYYVDCISINALQCCCVPDDTMSKSKFIFMYISKSQMIYVFSRSSH